MRKIAIGLTSCTILLALVAGYVRKTEIDTVFDSVSGLTRLEPVTYILAALSVFSALVIIFFTLKLRSCKPEPGFEKAFQINTLFVPVISFILFAMMVLAAFLYYDYIRKNMDIIIADGILALFAALSGIAFLTISINNYRRKCGAELPLCCFVIVIFICYWLIMTYKQKAANPVLLDYVYDALALCSSALAAYYVTGFCYNRGSLPKTLFFTNLSVYLCLIAVIGASPFPIKLFYVFTIVIMLLNSVTLLKNAVSGNVPGNPESAQAGLAEPFEKPAADANEEEP